MSPADKTSKLRLDELLVLRDLAADVGEAARLIRAGKVLLNESCVDKPGMQYPVECSIRLRHQAAFVSRGGFKLAGALDHFKLNPYGMVCADIGASTGGFTDCLLQRGARRVYAVDVAYGILDWKLRSDHRVVVLERLNARHLNAEHIDQPLDLAVCDASFISLTKIIPPLLQFFRESIRIIALVKPQFELPQDMIQPGGIVYDEAHRRQAVESIARFGTEFGLNCAGIAAASIKGTKGNQEYLLLFTRNG